MKLSKKKILCTIMSSMILQVGAFAEEKIGAENNVGEASVLLGEKDSLSTSILQSGSQAEAAAQNNTESSKKLSLGEVSVSLPGGGVSVSVSTPQFSAILDLSLSFSSGLYQSQKATGESSSAFGLPYGMYFSGLPYVHKVIDSGKKYTVLFWGGADYYVDPGFESGVDCDSNSTCNDTFSSGLKYQVSKMYQFEAKQAAVNIINDNGNQESLIYSYRLKYANGATYYFNDAGLCVLIADKFFVNNQLENSKHIARLNYKYNDRGALSNLLTSIVDGDGTVLAFKSNGNYISEIDYPKNPSGEAEVFKFDLVGGVLEGVSQRLDDKYDIGFTFDYDESGLVYKVRQVLFSRGSFHIERDYVDYVFHYNQFSDDGNIYKVTLLDKIIYGGAGEEVGRDQESYNYLMMTKPAYQFGADVGLDRADDSNYYTVASQVTQCVGVNCQLKVTHNYNIFGLELLTQTSEYIDGIDYKPISDTYYRYSGIINNQFDKSILSSTYNLPKSVVTVSYNNSGLPVAIAKQVSFYNDYGSPLEQKQYPQTKLEGNLKATSLESLLKGQSLEVPEYPSGIDPVSLKLFEYDDRYQNVTKTESYNCADGVNHTDCSKARIVSENISLTGDGRQVAHKYNVYKDLETGEVATDKTTSYTYSSDTAGCQSTDSYFNSALVCKETVSDNTGRSVSKTYGYERVDTDGYFPELITTEQRHFTDPSGVTSMAEIAGENQEEMGETITHNQGGYETAVISNFAALLGAENNEVGIQSLAKTTDYNVYGLPLVEKDKEGKKISYKYDFKNMIMEKYLEPTTVSGPNVRITQTKPLLQSRVQYDGLHNVLKKWDVTQNASNNDDLNLIVVQENNYDYREGKALLTKQVDTYGNFTLYEYDSQLRPIVKKTYRVKDESDQPV